MEEEDIVLHDFDPCHPITFSGLTSASEITNPLRRAIAEDNIITLPNLLHNNCNANLVDNLGNTCLHTAVAYGSLGSLQYLLSLSETRIDVRNNLGETPLFQALQSNADRKIINSLLLHKCDVNIANHEGVTPLHLAVRRRDEGRIASLLLANGADVDVRDFNGLTPLHEAVSYQDYETVCVLLYYNSPANEQSTFSFYTPMHQAVKSANTEIAELLLDYVDDFSLEDEHRDTPFSIAVKNKMNIAVEIVERGGDVHEIDRATKLPLIFCKLDASDKELFKKLWSKVNVFELFARSANLFPTHFLLDTFRFSNKEKLDILGKVLNAKEYYNFNHISEIYKLVYRLCNSKEARLEWTWILLSYGIPITTREVEYLFKMYGFCPEIEAILASETIVHATSIHDFVQQIVYNYPKLTLGCHGNEDCVNEIFMRKIRKYYRNAYAPYDRYVPNLQEISRDVIRQIIFKKYQRGACFKAYNAVMGLNLPQTLKEVLLLKLPIYY